MNTARTYAMLLLLSVATVAADSPNPSLLLPRSGEFSVPLPSVEASSLCRHFGHPINYATGTATVSYPIYTIECGELTLPLSITASTGAIKVDEEEGPMGLGWDLDIGGIVSRAVMGKPDTSATEDDIHAASNDNFTKIKGMFEHTVDNELDRYTWRAGAYSGVFVMLRDGNVIRPRSLTQTDCSISATATGFTIITPDGTEYSYGQPETVSYTYKPGVRTLYTPHDSIQAYSAYGYWRLLTVTGPSGTDVVTFNYAADADRKRVSTARPASFTVTRTIAGGQTATTGAGQVAASNVFSRDGGSTYTYTGRKILSSVTWRGGRIDVSRSSSRITGMTVKTHGGEAVMNAAFTYMETARTKQGRASQLHSYTITDAAGNVLDGATFYYCGCTGPVTKDIFGYNNTGGEMSTSSYHSSFESVLEIGDKYIQYNPSRLPYAPATPSCGVYSSALLSISSVAGTDTEFDYEPAWIGIDSVAHDRSFIGLRLRRVTVTDYTTGKVTRRSLGYSCPAASVHPDSIGMSAFVSIGGTRQLPTGYRPEDVGFITTGVTLLTASRMPGAALESSSVYYACVSDTLTGTDMAEPAVTTYEYDVSRVPGRMAYSSQYPYYTATDQKYFGTGISSISGESADHAAAIMQLVNPKIVLYQRVEGFAEKAPLRRVVEWRQTPAGADTLRVTEHFYRYRDEQTLLTGFFCEPVVRTRIEYSAQFDDIYTSDDFSRFPCYVTTGRVHRDSTHVREYDRNGTCRRIHTGYEYNDSCAYHPVRPGSQFLTSSIADNSLPYRTDVSCCGDTVRTVYHYPSSSWLLTGFTGSEQQQIRERRPALPVSIEYHHGTCTAERRFVYTRAGRQLPFLKPASEIVSIDGVCVDSVAIGSYTALGCPLSVTRNGGTPCAYTWDSSGLYPLSATTGTLTTAYTHKPLVGCTSVTTPAGTARTYAYSGMRLVSETFGGELVASYAYSLPSLLLYGRVDSSVYPSGSSGTPLVRTVCYDGYGRKTVEATAPSGSAALVRCTEYDAAGREMRLNVDAPCADFADHYNATSAASAHFGYSSRPFTARGYGSGGLVVRDTLPGADFAGHPALTERLFNRGTSGELACLRYTPGAEMITASGHYPDGSLEVARTVDGDGRVSLTFTDFRGRIILERKVSGSGPYSDTHYLYDDADNLVMVLPPRASARCGTPGTVYRFSLFTVLRDSTYRYVYDSRQLLAEKRTPGCGAERYWYDSTRRLVLTQDARQRQRGQASFVLADACGREAVTGVCRYTDALAAAVESSAVTAERDDSGSLMGYRTALQIDSAVVFTASYYDDYGFLDMAAFSALRQRISARGIASQRQSDAGLPTGAYTRTLDPTNYYTQLMTHPALPDTYTAVYHDGRERTVRTVSLDHTGAFNDEELEYSGTDMVTSAKYTHTPASGTAQTYRYTYTYDGYDRQKTVKLTRGGVTRTLLTNTYDAAGRLTKVAYGSGQSMAMTYAVSGAPLTLQAGTAQSRTYTQTLGYATGTHPSYSGNISSMAWRGADGVNRRYDYTYDGLNRLTSAQYSETGSRTAATVASGTPDYSTSYTYYLDSNPVRITRKGVTDIAASGPALALSFGTVDDLRLTYKGPRLMKVTDSAADVIYTGAPDFSDGTNTGNDYAYDVLGNTVSDSNRGITSIEYNEIGRPKLVLFSDNTSIRNVYDARGTLLRQTTGTRIQGVGGNTVPLYSYEDRIGALTYAGSTLSRIDTPNGYISEGATRYYISDHQGNVRQVVDSVGTVLQDNHYYPFGMLMGESSDILEANRTQSALSGNPYRYNGNRLITHHNAHFGDFHARWYDFQTLRFLQPDPFREKYYPLPPYLYCASNPILLIDRNGLDPSTQEDALKYIEDFKNNDNIASVFKNIPKSVFIKGLIANIINPENIKQGQNGTCGAAVASKFLAQKNPLLYARLAIDLFTKGSSTNNGSTVSIPESMKEGSDQQLSKIGINPAEAIVQGAITNSSNMVLDYDSFKDGVGVRSFMLPGSLCSFLSNYGGAKVSHITFPNGNALKNISKDSFIIGTVNVNNSLHISEGFPNHYVQIVNYDGRSVSYWSWGKSGFYSDYVGYPLHGIYSIIRATY